MQGSLDASYLEESTKRKEQSIMPYSVSLPIRESIVIPMEDPIIHNEGHPFCADSTCPCRSDFDNINLLVDLVKQGLLTQNEANMVMRGATI